MKTKTTTKHLTRSDAIAAAKQIAGTADRATLQRRFVVELDEAGLYLLTDKGA